MQHAKRGRERRCYFPIISYSSEFRAALAWPATTWPSRAHTHMRSAAHIIYTPICALGIYTIIRMARAAALLAAWKINKGAGERWEGGGGCDDWHHHPSLRPRGFPCAAHDRKRERVRNVPLTLRSLIAHACVVVVFVAAAAAHSSSNRLSSNSSHSRELSRTRKV